MFRRITLAGILLLLCISAGRSFAQSTSEPHKESPPTEISFYNWGIFAEQSQYGNTSKQGAGAFACIGYDYDWKKKSRFRPGWTLDCVLGYGGKPSYMPYVLDLSLTCGYRLNKESEVGVKYCFMGTFGYATTAFVGSQLNLFYRYRFIQLEGARSRNTIFVGCFLPSGSMAPAAYQASVSLFFFKRMFAGVRYLTPSGAGDAAKPSEFRLFAGFDLQF